MTSTESGAPPRPSPVRGWGLGCGASNPLCSVTVDNVIAAMEANRPNLTRQKSFFVDTSRVRDRAELVTDDEAALSEQIEAATGERIAALDAVASQRAKGRESSGEAQRSAGREAGGSPTQERKGPSGSEEIESSLAANGVNRGLGL